MAKGQSFGCVRESCAAKGNDFAQLLSCARENDVPGIDALLDIGCPPTFCNGVGQSALHVGAMWGSVDAVRRLLDAKADPLHENQLRGATPLHAAAVGRGPANLRAKCAELLVEHKGDPRKADWRTSSPLDCASDKAVRIALGGLAMLVHNAVQGRCVSDLKDSLQKVKEGAADDLTLDTTNDKGDTALHLAVKSKWPTGLELILEARSDPSVCNAEKRTPLHTAVLSGECSLVKTLLAHKADVAATDRDPDYDPRFKSTSFAHNPDEHRTALHYAAALGSIEVIEALLSSKANVNAKDSQGQSPLHLCLDLRSAPEIGRGCGVRLQAVEGKPHWNGLLGTVLEDPAALDGEDGDDSDAECLVLIAGTAADSPSQGVMLKLSNLELVIEDVLDLLLDASADVNDGNRRIGESMTWLHTAAKSGDVSLARKLVAARADQEKVDKLGLSALHLAARSKHVELVRVLLESRADPRKKASNGKSAADLAMINGKTRVSAASAEIVALLSKDAAAAPTGDGYPSLHAQQRAALFMD
eukprot:TRINITY_DN60841_c0_g1_i1.p1 TRINITY_DN60841_c0_g1~~TRINITY_DN60841_c0_g1_i1.p1  ORF type:complete len:531 (-),score=98.35 TRINITY_DN60841_c0_g1_i1:150-1742(-)